MDTSNNSGYGRIIVGAVAGLLALIAIVGFFSSYNWAVAQENAIIANKDSAKNVLGQYTPKLREALGVTRLQAKDVANIFTRSNEARYGAEGSTATVQWIREQNPTLDQSNYRRIIDMIESGRDDFKNAQDQQIDRVRNYRTGAQQFPTVLYLSVVGKPSPGFFEKYEGIVVSGHADEAFKTGIDDGVDVANMQ